MRQLSVLMSLAIISIAGNLMALEDRPTVNVTKDDLNYYAWHCDQRLSSNATDIPLDVAALAIKNGNATQVDTAKSKISGFAGLNRDRTIKERAIVFNESTASLNAEEWQDVESGTTTNVPMLPVLIFGLFMIAIIALRGVKAIGPKLFWFSLNIPLYSMIAIFSVSGILKLINNIKTLPSWTVVAGLIMALVIGAATGLLLSIDKGKTDPKRWEGRLKLSRFLLLPTFAVLMPLAFGSLPGMLSMMSLTIAIFAICWLSSILVKALKAKKESRNKKAPAPTVSSPTPA